MVPDDGRRGKKDLRLSLFPNIEGLPKYLSALLNGLEIFKLSDSSRSLAAANPDPKTTSSSPVNPPLGKKKKGGSSVVYAVIGSIVGFLAIVAALSFLIFRRRRKVKDSETTSATKTSWVPFSTTSRGGFGNVYKGYIDDGATAVAIKRLNRRQIKEPANS
ncbi:UNVERIFIED_CONTAM: putative receptor-like protein kinase [Sesamum latifolium]|uniref:Receptor-like protein kinase n=1 Tax=Sesamum latifolium TaxID=2727402 RepID=A0AAW2X9D3_9LAMI